GEAQARKAEAGHKSRPASHPVLALLAKRPDLAGLPARGADECQRDPATTALMGAISKDLRLAQGNISLRSGQAPPTSLSHRDYVDLLDAVRDEWLKEDGVRTVVQILQAGDTDQRLGLVQVLVRSKARTSTEALARLALFDLAPEVRLATVRALAAR